MFHSSSPTFLRELFLGSCDTPVAVGEWDAKGKSPLLGLARLSDLTALIPFQHASLNSSRRSIANHWNSSRHSETKPDGGTIGEIIVFGQKSNRIAQRMGIKNFDNYKFAILEQA